MAGGPVVGPPCACGLFHSPRGRRYSALEPDIGHQNRSLEAPFPALGLRSPGPPVGWFRNQRCPGRIASEPDPPLIAQDDSNWTFALTKKEDVASPFCSGLHRVFNKCGRRNRLKKERALLPAAAFPLATPSEWLVSCWQSLRKLPPVPLLRQHGSGFPHRWMPPEPWPPGPPRL